MTIQLDDIEIKYNPRTQFIGIDELSRSIKELGILQPLTVAKNGNGKYVLLDGQRRFMACKKLGLKDIPVIERNLDEQQQKEVPIATDFFKDKLKLSEKIIGIANLINVEKKVNEQILAKRYGWSVAEVKRLLKLSTLHPEVLKLIDEGTLKVNQGLELSNVKREDVQIKLAHCMTTHSWYGLVEALEEVAFELPFDDVFTYEEAKKDNKIGIVVKDETCGERVFTYDKEYFELKKGEFEEREKKSYAKQEKKSQKNRAEQIELSAQQKKETKEKKKKERTKAKAKLDSTLNIFKDVTLAFLAKKPVKEEIGKLVDKFILQVSMDNCKLILKAFDIPFKASEMQSSDYKNEAKKVIGNLVKTETELIKLILYVDSLSEVYKTTMFDLDGIKKVIVKLAK
ncbi:MAG: hypothetical protein COV72_02380 [Candidatus Omnitrophica bacterium CG11_big_fil_rev_8_21_14_0_20_42_13]|uniref:ParB-like N-terminal domain-containing protein n=1 Tax=Candidatus Ghiorseimicrobium undicola TaxID=1974746 RepID=A0A2H0LYW1_9BACT|nr:MAG: hypothetical protein COV72_02380 [Candidatus Omnitrophica bacterium CG11_big_fil_rev_8_21_14_0_20_42_13]